MSRLESRGVCSGRAGAEGAAADGVGVGDAGLACAVAVIRAYIQRVGVGFGVRAVVGVGDIAGIMRNVGEGEGEFAGMVADETAVGAAVGLQPARVSIRSKSRGMMVRRFVMEASLGLLFIAQGLDGIQASGAGGRVNTEEKAHRGGESSGQQDGLRRDDRS